MSSWTLEELEEKQEELHTELVHELELASHELLFAMEVAFVTFLFPVSLINKFVFAKCERRPFYLSIDNYIDFAIFILVLVWYEAYAIFAKLHLDYPLFGEPEDSQADI